VIAQATRWEEFPGLWPGLLAEVWQAVRSAPGITPGRNVMLYKDDAPNVEIGVEVEERSFAARGRVTPSRLPGGRVLALTYRGPYAGLASAHATLVAACGRRGLERIGPRWEIYGHHDERAESPEVELCYLLG
jgi:effector-binding domain-containing protein